MALQDLFSAEIYYQANEEVLGLNLTYTESQIASPDLACQNLAEAIAEAIEDEDFSTELALEFSWYGVRVVCISDSDHNPYEQPMAIAGGRLEDNAPDMVTALVNLLGTPPDLIPTISRLQFSCLPISAVVQNSIDPTWITDFGLKFRSAFQFVNSKTEGNWALAIPHVSSPGLDPIGVVAETISIQAQSGSRYDRKSNTPNTGRKRNGEVIPITESEAAVKRRVRRRSRQERSEAFKKLAGTAGVSTAAEILKPPTK